MRWEDVMMVTATMSILAVMGGAVFTVLDRSSLGHGRSSRWSLVLLGASATAMTVILAIAVTALIRG